MAEERTAAPAAAAAPADTGFDDFYRRTSSQAYGLALRIAGEPAAARAACEAAYVRAWRQREANGTLEPVLLEQVRAEALRRRTPEASAPSPRSEKAHASYDPAAAVRAALAQLEPTARRAIELAFFGGVRAADIAEIVGEPEARVRALMRAGLLRIAEATPARKETVT